MESKKESRYSDKEVNDKYVLFTLIQTILEDGTAAFFYLAIKGAMLESFKNASEAGIPFDLADYGKVILSGYGEPNREIMQYMEDNFGFNHAEVPRLVMTGDGLKEVKPKN